jgi:hypothetical protein
VTFQPTAKSIIATSAPIATPGDLPWRIVTLSEKHDVRCLIDADDFNWLNAWRWNYGWHAKTKWKLYAKRNTGAERSTIYMHREILIRATHGADQEFFAAHHAHHENSQSLDNRKVNLAWTTPAVNSSIWVKRDDIPTIDEIVEKLMAEYAPRLTLADVPFP